MGRSSGVTWSVTTICFVHGEDSLRGKYCTSSMYAMVLLQMVCNAIVCRQRLSQQYCRFVDLKKSSGKGLRVFNMPYSIHLHQTPLIPHQNPSPSRQTCDIVGKVSVPMNKCVTYHLHEGELYAAIDFYCS